MVTFYINNLITFKNKCIDYQKFANLTKTKKKKNVFYSYFVPVCNL